MNWVFNFWGRLMEETISTHDGPCLPSIPTFFFLRRLNHQLLIEIFPAELISTTCLQDEQTTCAFRIYFIKMDERANV